MKIDQLNASQLKKLQKQLEEIAVKDLDLSSEKVINLSFPVASYDYEDGEVASQFFILGRWGKPARQRGYSMSPAIRRLPTTARWYSY
jgi:hypothetical protein